MKIPKIKREKKEGSTKGRGVNTFIVMIGDDGAILVHMQKGKVVKRLFAQSPESNHTKAFDEILSANPKTPITLLIDVMDQSYIRQTLPPVSSLSVGKIITRRLSKDFAPDDIKGYILLGRDKGGRKDWNYMMVSVANSPILQKWIAFLVERSNPFKGIGMIPLESQKFLIEIEKEANKSRGKDTKPLEWQVLVSHNKVGGFRQIVLRHGKLVFTRMAQPFGDSLPEVLAGNIEQEMINTFEYLKRMGLQDTMDISVAIIASEAIRNSIDVKNIRSGAYIFLTPFEASEIIGLKDAAQPQDHFGDVVISAFVAKQKRLLLPLHTDYTRKILKMVGNTKLLDYFAAAVSLGCLIWASLTGYDIITTKGGFEDVEKEHNKISLDLSDIKAKTASLPKEVNLYSDIMNLTDLLNKPKFTIPDFVGKVAITMQNAAIVKQISWSLYEPLKIDKTSDDRKMKAEIEFRLTTPQEPIEKFIQENSSFLERVKKSFTGFSINNSELPGLLSDSKELKTVLGGDESKQKDGKQTEILTIAIEGPTPEEKGQKNVH
ncbi:MAG: hypothetical protein WCL30_00360 [Pseudomonadota bacterium]